MRINAAKTQIINNTNVEINFLQANNSIEVFFKNFLIKFNYI